MSWFALLLWNKFNMFIVFVMVSMLQWYHFVMIAQLFNIGAIYL